jgi:hypothetical protein
MMSDYEKTQNRQFVIDAVEVYVNDMTPRLKNLMNIKYAKSYVDYEDDGTYKLIQLQYSVEQLDFVLGDQVVEKMQLGLKEPKEKKKKETQTVVVEENIYEKEGYGDETRKIGD